MKDRLQIAIEKMQSVDMIRYAEFLYNNQHRRCTNSQMADELDFSLCQVRSRRNNLKLQHGFKFSITDEGTMLIDITNEIDKRYAEQQKAYTESKRKKPTRVKAVGAVGFGSAFSLMGV